MRHPSVAAGPRPSRYAVLLAALLAACATGGSSYSPTSPVAPARDLPERFLLPEGISPTAGACYSPLRDPRDGTELRMARSFTNGIGDYEAPDGRYGTTARLLLRVECATGTPRGLVPR